MTEKSWSDFGKASNKDGKFTASATAVSWITSVVAGSLGGILKLSRFDF